MCTIVLYCMIFCRAVYCITEYVYRWTVQHHSTVQFCTIIDKLSPTAQPFCMNRTFILHLALSLRQPLVESDYVGAVRGSPTFQPHHSGFNRRVRLASPRTKPPVARQTPASPGFRRTRESPGHLCVPAQPAFLAIPRRPLCQSPWAGPCQSALETRRMSTWTRRARLERLEAPRRRAPPKWTAAARPPPPPR